MGEGSASVLLQDAERNARVSRVLRKEDNVRQEWLSFISGAVPEEFELDLVLLWTRFGTESPARDYTGRPSLESSRSVIFLRTNTRQHIGTKRLPMIKHNHSDCAMLSDNKQISVYVSVYFHYSITRQPPM